MPPPCIPTTLLQSLSFAGDLPQETWEYIIEHIVSADEGNQLTMSQLKTLVQVLQPQLSSRFWLGCNCCNEGSSTSSMCRMS